MKIGLLGGSFNPAHDGHRHISLLALDLLGLDQVWWMVSPQNPLKAPTGMASLNDRLAHAREVANDPRIVPSDIETELGTRYTTDTVRTLRRRFPEVRFVWLMGADNLAQVPQWKKWRTLFRTVPIAIFDRPTYSRSALNGKAARRFTAGRLPERQAKRLATSNPPAWIFFRGRLNVLSATTIRARHAADLGNWVLDEPKHRR